jgi:maleylacetate reductase
MERVVYGSGCVADLGVAGERLGSRAVVITGASLAGEGDQLAKVTAALGERCVAVLPVATAHVPRQSIVEVAERLREHEADLIVTFGGGSAIDTGKAAAFAVAAGIHAPEQFDAYVIGARPATRLPDVAVLPNIAVPTTLSGAEFTEYTAVTDPRRGSKNPIRDIRLMPRQVLLDPDLTVATPAHLWASTGMRAMDHCIESICSTRPQAFADALCAAALRALPDALRASASDPGDRDSRLTAQLGMWQAAFGIPNVPQGLSHALGHGLGAYIGVPHGVASAIVLPEVVLFNAPATAHRLPLVADCLGLGRTVDPAAAIADHLRALRGELGLPSRLSDCGVDEASLMRIAEIVAGDFNTASNPVAVDGPAVLLKILEAVY